MRHSPSGWVTAAPDRRIYPRPHFELTLTSEYNKLTTSYQPPPTSPNSSPALSDGAFLATEVMDFDGAKDGEKIIKFA